QSIATARVPPSSARETRRARSPEVVMDETRGCPWVGLAPRVSCSPCSDPPAHGLQWCPALAVGTDTRREACPDARRVFPDPMVRCFVLESGPTTCNGRSDMRKGGRYGAEWHTRDAAQAHLRAPERAGVARHAGLAAGRCGAGAWWGPPHRHDGGGYIAKMSPGASCMD